MLYLGGVLTSWVGDGTSLYLASRLGSWKGGELLGAVAV